MIGYRGFFLIIDNLGEGLEGRGVLIGRSIQIVLMEGRRQGRAGSGETEGDDRS